MVIVNAPLRADLFREKAESLGLVYVSKVGMKLSFNAPNGDDKEKAAELKKLQGRPAVEHSLFPVYYRLIKAPNGGKCANVRSEGAGTVAGPF